MDHEKQYILARKSSNLKIKPAKTCPKLPLFGITPADPNTDFQITYI